MDGVVAIWDWYQGFDKPPIETVLDRRDLNFMIKDCQKGHSVFLRHRHPDQQHHSLYDVKKR
jgi:hypothetical protein